MVYKTQTKKFMNETGRFINVDGEEWLVVKDMFGWLDRLTSENKIAPTDKRNLNQFLGYINQTECLKEFDIKTPKGEMPSTSKRSNSNGLIGDTTLHPLSNKRGEVQKGVKCIKIDVVPMVLTQFEPTAKASKEKHEQWCELMQFINNILMELEVHKFITVDKDYQKDCMERLRAIVPDSCPDNVYKTVNNHIAMIMGQLMSMNSPIYKKDITQFNNQTTVDLLVVREEALDLYLTMYELTNSFEQSYNNTLNGIKKRHNIA